jgi:uncharacterized membrane protein YcfT
MPITTLWLVAVIAVALAGYLVFHLSRNAQFKRRYYPAFVVLVVFISGGFRL